MAISRLRSSRRSQISHYAATSYRLAMALSGCTTSILNPLDGTSFPKITSLYSDREMFYRTKLINIIKVVLLLSGILCSCSALNHKRSTIIDSTIEGKIQEIIVSGELPSVQMALIAQNQLVWLKAYGQNTDTHFVYMNGSVQKVVDATAILQLHETGKIDLDADISDYIPFEIKHPEYPDIPITIRMLLSHRSGLDAFGDQFSWDTECLFYPKYRPNCNPETQRMPLEEYLIASFTPDGSNFNPKAWVNKPGETYHYSVSSYPMLRYLIEQVTLKPYPDYMKENIFEPLGMLNSGFSSADYGTQHTIPYTRIRGENIELPVWNGNGYMMRTTAEDMTKFMLAHLNNGLDNHFQLLQPETIEIMQTKASRGKSILNPNTELTDSGYGLGLIHYQGGWMGHGGSTVGYQSLWQFNPSKQCGFIIFTNVNGILGGKDDFLSVWENVAAIRDIFMRQLDPFSTLDYFPWGYILTWATIILFANFIKRWLRRRHASLQEPHNP
jgi:CubicO group peptidase (beta-lactamase class C family)